VVQPPIEDDDGALCPTMNGLELHDDYTDKNAETEINNFDYPISLED
jgi:hypothetical protein